MALKRRYEPAETFSMDEDGFFGELYLPTRSPACCKIAASIAQVEPFPLVPATWITDSCSCTLESCSINACMPASPSTLPYCFVSSRKALASSYVNLSFYSFCITISNMQAVQCDLLILYGNVHIVPFLQKIY